MPGFGKRAYTPPCRASTSSFPASSTLMDSVTARTPVEGEGGPPAQGTPGTGVGMTAACALALVKDRGGRRVHEGPAVRGCGPSISSGSLLTSLSLCLSPSPLSPSPPLFLLPFPLPCPNSHALALTLSTLAGEPASGVWPWLSHRVTQPQPRSQALGATAGPTGAAEDFRTENKWHQRTTELRIPGPAIRVHRSWQDSGHRGQRT